MTRRPPGCGVRRALAAGALLLVGSGCATTLDRGEAAFRRGDLPRAIAVWGDVPRGTPDYDEAQARIARAGALGRRIVADRLEQAEAYRAEGRFAEAIQGYREALALDPAHPAVRARMNGLVRRLAREKAAGRGRVAARLAAGDLAAAHDELLVLKILDPFDADVLERLEALEPERVALGRRHLEEARALASRGQYAAGIAAAARALDYEALAGEAEALLTELSRRQRAHGEAQADTTSRRAAALPGPAVDAALRRGQALEQAGQPLEALREFARAAESSRRDPRLAAEMAALRGALGDRAEAAFVQGIRHYRAERMQLAIREWETVLLIEPAHEKARVYIEKARKVLEKLEAIRREDAAAAVPASTEAK